MAEKPNTSTFPLGESYSYLKKSLDNLQQQQSGEAPPDLYPDENPPEPDVPASSAQDNDSQPSANSD